MWQAGWHAELHALEGPAAKEASGARLEDPSASASEGTGALGSSGLGHRARFGSPQIRDVPPGRSPHGPSVAEARQWHRSALQFSKYDFDKPLIRQLTGLGDRIEALEQAVAGSKGT